MVSDSRQHSKAEADSAEAVGIQHFSVKCWKWRGRAVTDRSLSTTSGIAHVSSRLIRLWRQSLHGKNIKCLIALERTTGTRGVAMIGFGL
jgi:hypothetical protein